MLMIMGLSVLIIFLADSISTDLEEGMDDASAKYKEHIGEDYILNKDTLTIIDYSIWNDSFTLSNGVEVSYQLIAKEE